MRRFILGLALTAVSVGLLVRLIDWNDTIDALQAANPWLIALAVLALILSLMAKTIRWRVLLPAEPPVAVSRLYRILHISFMLNNVLPARLGDVARVAMTSRQPNVRVGAVLSSLVTERLTDAVTLLTCFVAISPFLRLPRKYDSWLEWAWITLAVAAALVILGAILRKPMLRLLARMPLPGALPGHPRLKEEARSFSEGFTQLFARNRQLPIWGYSAIAWLGAFAINYLVMRALDIDAPLTVAVLLTCTTNLAMLLPSSPGYIGVFHAAATLSLLPFGVGAAHALSFAIVAHLVNVLPVSLLGLIFLASSHESLPLSWKSGESDGAGVQPELPVPPGAAGS